MAANAFSVVNTLYAVQYDGTNSADIAALEPGFNFNNDTEENGVWSFQSPPDSMSFVVNTGDWIMFSQNQVFYKWSNSEFVIQYSCNALCEDLEAFSTGQQVRAIGVAPIPSLATLATADVDVTLQPAMPNTTFTAHASTFAGVSLADLDITAVTILDADTVRVSVENTGLVTLEGATVMVHAVA